MSIFALASCKTSDNTIVIDDAPTTSGRADTTEQEVDDTFQQLTLGEIVPVRSLDPLFANNVAELHAAQLLYEGLVQYDDAGETVPAIASDWSVRNDEKTYRITINNDIFYHDSDIFSNGLGRKLTATDVVYVFERMAKANVPGRAAQLFMNIKGFEPYYQEQHQILQPQDRQLKTISGITIENDSTIIFSLTESDPQFLNKLATPWASIYPKEAVTTSGFKAVGTGPFKFSQKRNDALYIFSRFENYRVENQPELKRVDLRIYSDPTALTNALNRDEAQLIPQLGPQHMSMLLNGNGELKASATDLVLLGTNHTSTYFVRYHEGADVSRSGIISTLQRVDTNQLFPDLPARSVEVTWPEGTTSSAPAADSLSATYTADPYISTFYEQLSRQLRNEGITFSMSDSRIPNRNTPLFTEIYLPAYNVQMESSAALITLTFKTPGVSRSEVENVKFNSVPWWIDLRQTTVSTQ